MSQIKNKPTTKEFIRLEELKAMPFYSKGINSPQDKKNRIEWITLSKTIVDKAKNLKIGELVEFNFPLRTKNKNSFFGYDFLDNYLIGTVSKVLYNKKRSSYGETDLIPTIKVELGNIIYEVSPEDIISYNIK